MTVVYDVSELDDLDNFNYDVKILYQLTGCRFKTFNELCNLFLDEGTMNAYKHQSERVKSHLKSYTVCGIAIEKYPLTDLVPKSVLDNIQELRNSLTERLFNRFHSDEVFAFYELFYPKVKCLHEIAKTLNLKFNFVGTKTGRLSFRKNTFNPYILSKQNRKCIQARPGYHLCEYDLKSSQPRVAIFSTFDADFKEKFRHIQDIYALFSGDRKENKVAFLRWMYSSGYIADDKFDCIMHPIKELRSAVSSDASKCGIIHNRFHRPLFFAGEPDNVVFQNFITSTEADALYETICKMQTVLDGKQSRILFPFYDSVVCEIKDEELKTQNELKKIIENNYIDRVFFCQFPVEVKTGQDFSNLH